MNPIRRYTIITLTLIINVASQKFQHEQFTFPPHYQNPSPSMFSSDSTIYLPPDSSTPIPYYPNNNINKYPVKFLPPTASKVSSIYPTPFPMISSTLNTELDDESSIQKDIPKLRTLSQHRSLQISKNINDTDNTSHQTMEKREMRTIHKIPSFQPKIEIGNGDIKKSEFVAAPTTPILMLNQNPAVRRMIVTSEFQRNENALDQLKSASFANAQYLQAPGVIISSTTEPAIPIIRLSNEMDLDGSFSYEALGADQTHYVQHSRMENMGTDKEEQVVEGSYSYVGDNGQTFTVHYVADSNGYRASGDHLPVPPPIPEIIQRAIQYNLAEEAKIPPHLRQNWENESKDYENDETRNRYSVTSLRNLFTGRTPEAFSLGFSQGSNSQNNLVSSASANIPIKASFNVISDQLKSKTNAQITPQITFLGSQGINNPSPQQQQTLQRPASTEKSNLPQIMNYEADIKDSDLETNKALWRWQYGTTTNDNSNQNKNTISRSFGEGDDVIINFNNMTPEEYTRMIHSQISNQHSDSNTYLTNSKDLSELNKPSDNFEMNSEVNFEKGSKYDDIKILSFDNYKTSTENNAEFLVNENNVAPTSSANPKHIDTLNSYNYNNEYQSQNHQKDQQRPLEIYPKIISSQNFLPKSNLVTQMYNFNDITEIDILKEKTKTEKPIPEEKEVESATQITFINNKGGNNNVNPVSSTTDAILNAVDSNANYYDFSKESFKNDFKPVTSFYSYYENNSESPTSTEPNELKENIFLKNIFKINNNELKSTEYNNMTPKAEALTVSDAYELKPDKIPKILQHHSTTNNEIKFNKKKPLDINEVLNYMTLKNAFESAKTRPKNRATIDFNPNFVQKEIRPVRYIPTIDSTRDNEDERNDLIRTKNSQQNELRGIIKNYKVLQRQRPNTNENHFIPELTHRNIKTFHNVGLPPLGRAGPSLKSYLPPTFN